MKCNRESVESMPFSKMNARIGGIGDHNQEINLEFEVTIM